MLNLTLPTHICKQGAVLTKTQSLKSKCICASVISCFHNVCPWLLLLILCYLLQGTIREQCIYWKGKLISVFSVDLKKKNPNDVRHRRWSEKKNDILLNLQNQKYNLKCCNRATGDDIRSLNPSMYPEWVLNTRGCQYAYGALFFYLKKNQKKNQKQQQLYQKQIKMECTKIGRNAKTPIVGYMISLCKVYRI